MPQGTTRTPVAYLVVGGAKVPLIKCTVVKSRQQESDYFEGTCSISDLGSLSPDYFSRTTPLPGSIQAGDGGSGALTQVIAASLETVEIDWRKRTLYFRAQDAYPIYNTTDSDTYKNQRASQLAATLAGKAGFDFNKTFDDSEQQGKLDTQDYVRLHDFSDIGTILSFLAERSGATWYVKDQTVYWGKSNDSSWGTWNVTYRGPTPAGHAESNVAMGLRTARNVSMSATLQGVVQGFNPDTKQVVTSKMQVQGGGGAPLVYNREYPKLTQEQADNINRKQLSDAATQEMIAVVDAPGDLSVTVDMQMQLSGTGTAWDQSYFIYVVEYRWERADGGSATSVTEHGGFTMTVTGKNSADGRSPAPME